LLLHDLLRIRDCLGCIGVLEAAASLSVLELGTDARADADRVALSVRGTTRTASLFTVCVRDATSGGELLALSVADITGAGVVWGKSDSPNRDYITR
jgi:hypothetical protein